MFKKQWVGFEGAPTYQTLSSHTPLRNERIGLGLLLVHENMHVIDNYEIYTNYAFRFPLGNGRLSLGLKAGFSLRQAGWSEIETYAEGTADPVFSQGYGDCAFLPNAGFGVYFRGERMHVGFSVPYLLHYQENETHDGFTMQHSPEFYDFLGFFSYRVVLTNMFSIEPMTLIRYRINRTAQVDAGVKFLWNNAIGFGGTYRTPEQLTLMAEYQINEQFWLGYSYDYPFGELSNATSGSHGIILRYDLRFKIEATNPRNF
jgi:type IX secretion system PorP/SprF family membrane protein